jgi:transcriptional regulator with XRE-family HTH domain
MNWGLVLMGLNPGRTQTEIAEKYGVAQAGVSRIMTGKYQPRMESIRLMAKAEGVRMWELMKMVEEYQDAAP